MVSVSIYLKEENLNSEAEFMCFLFKVRKNIEKENSSMMRVHSTFKDIFLSFFKKISNNPLQIYKNWI